jgi:hypothetical protein
MVERTPYDTLFVIFAFALQIALIAFFITRTWAYATALDFGWIVYALALPALVVSLILLRAGRPWYQWLAGFAYTTFAIFGYVVDIAVPVSFRDPVYWPILLPYAVLYVGSLMFYWFPVGRLSRRLWFIYGGLYAVSTALNALSHGGG